MNTKSEQRTNMTDSKICEECGFEMQYVQDYFSRHFNDGRSKYHWECQNCVDIREKKIERLEKEKKEKEEFERIHHGIPKIYRHCKMSDFKNIDTVIKWAKQPAGFLFIRGTTGTGKTHLICAIKKRYNEINISSSLFFSSEVFLSIRNSFNPTSQNSPSEEQIINNCTRGIAFFDDFGTQKNSDYSIETWYNIINTRYINNIPTVFTSNITLKEISTQMSDRIASRLVSGVVFELKGTDRRLLSRGSTGKPYRDLTNIF